MPPKTKAEATLSQTLPTNHKNATSALLSSLSELEEMLAPLTATSTSLSETLAKLDTEKRCQLELLLAYALNTFAFINLKSNGHTTNHHPVMQELKRIKAYTEKLRVATHGNKANMEVDKDAASRFIKNALAANVSADRKAEEESAKKVVPQGTHTRLDYDSDDNENMGNAANSTTIAQSTPTSTSSSSSKIRKRGMDPFHGYGEENKKSKSG
ncbi:hypothetical protein BGZ76_001098 [Entomortierella beljakovae]|nr:hypothetical protein BGZ76_001098 [Entomortierella beljakovae]